VFGLVMVMVMEGRRANRTGLVSNNGTDFHE
jgi:hypothetical protein